MLRFVFEVSLISVDYFVVNFETTNFFLIIIPNEVLNIKYLIDSMGI